MRWWKSPRAAAAAVAAVSVLLSVTVVAPSAVAAQGCISFPTFCAWDLPYMKGPVRNVVDPLPSPLLGKRVCYDLHGLRRSLVNDTGYTAVVYDDPNCTSLNAAISPRGFMNDNLGIRSVLFLAT